MRYARFYPLRGNGAPHRRFQVACSPDVCTERAINKRLASLREARENGGASLSTSAPVPLAISLTCVGESFSRTFRNVMCIVRVRALAFSINIRTQEWHSPVSVFAAVLSFPNIQGFPWLKSLIALLLYLMFPVFPLLSKILHSVLFPSSTANWNPHVHTWVWRRLEFSAQLAVASL